MPQEWNNLGRRGGHPANGIARCRVGPSHPTHIIPYKNADITPPAVPIRYGTVDSIPPITLQYRVPTPKPVDR
jgi:hypothetical protein